MNELIIELSDINPKEFFGHHNSNIELIKSYFPKLKIVARGSKIKVYGNEERLEEFDKRFAMILEHFSKYNKIDENSIERVLTSDSSADYTTPQSASEVFSLS
ncbi:MAG: phosphate starvation-inducible protein PhoH, partial [Psychroflexus sp.]|nr:phosphate starvation-inducible protein PhoH [Psychroflexus sp.]